MADPNPSEGFIREVDEELRQEQIHKIWAKYGNYIVAACVALVLIVAGHEGWTYYDTLQREEYGSQFFEASRLAETGKQAEAEAAFTALAAESSGGRAVAARLRIAGLKSRDGDTAGAAEAYFAIADDSGADKIYRDLATVLGAMNALETENHAIVTSRVAPLLSGDNPWRHSAQELTALAAARAGDVATARDMFKKIADDATATPAMRARALALAGGLPG
ncbi:MAG: tetratricopeptide repeat protein [Magnetospiraceae bacterium]